MKHIGRSQSATPATQNEATRRLKPPKVTTVAELARGTAIRPSRKRLRTVANGCGRLRTVAQRRANTPSTSRVKREPLLRIQEKTSNNSYSKKKYYTSSTAQDGGGSFKNRKPIGELGCCESGMAERSH